MKPTLTSLSLLLITCFSMQASADTMIKMTGSGLCHAPDSPHYSRIKHYTPFDNMEACLAKGGHLPKHAQKNQTMAASFTKNTDHGSVLTDHVYSRQQFGKGWADLDHDCQNSRTEALIEQSLIPVTFKTPQHCQVISGRWRSPYSGMEIYQASKIDIDHVVPLKWAWNHGANHWTLDKRKALANDPANLLSVGASLNRQKGAKGLISWLPPINKCQYITRFERIVKTHDLTLTKKEAREYPQLERKYCA